MFIFQSQVDPNPDNLAANCLNEANRDRNVKLVEVNARVTMVIWIIECFASVFIVFWNMVAVMIEVDPGMSNLYRLLTP